MDIPMLLAELGSTPSATARASGLARTTIQRMMTGALIQSGFEPVNIPYARQEEFNVALDELFRTDDGSTLIEFLTTCTMPDTI